LGFAIYISYALVYINPLVRMMKEFLTNHSPYLNRIIGGQLSMKNARADSLGRRKANVYRL